MKRLTITYQGDIIDLSIYKDSCMKDEMVYIEIFEAEGIRAGCMLNKKQAERIMDWLNRWKKQKLFK